MKAIVIKMQAHLAHGITEGVEGLAYECILDKVLYKVRLMDGQEYRVKINPYMVADRGRIISG